MNLPVSKQPDPAEVEAEIQALKDLLPLAPDYKRAINVSLRVLESHMSHDDVFDIYEGSDLFDDAHCTLLWRDDGEGRAPSIQFREMI